MLERLHLVDHGHGFLQFQIGHLTRFLSLSLCLSCLLHLLAQLVVLMDQVVDDLLIVLRAELRLSRVLPICFLVIFLYINGVTVGLQVVKIAATRIYSVLDRVFSFVPSIMYMRCVMN